jgi:FAD:protein FMN transferase
VKASGLYTTSFMAMGTRCDVVLIHNDVTFSERVARVLQNETGQLEHQLNRHIPDSPVSQFNRMASGEIFSPGENLWSILLQCRNYYYSTFGAFDITASPVIQLWKDKAAGFAVDPEKLSKAMEISGFDKLIFDPEHKTISRKTDGMQLDFGAIGKGIALDNMKKILDQFKVKTAFVSFGESSVMALGSHPAGEYWPVGIPDPYDPSVMLHTFRVKDAFVTTSGTVIRPDNDGARNRMHIVDPRTGKAISSRTMVSVMSESAVYGEVISTAWLVLTEKEKQSLKDMQKDTEIFFVNFENEMSENSVLTHI